MHKRYLFLIFFTCFVGTAIIAQQLSIADLLKTWGTTDVTQTEKYYSANEDLAKHPDEQVFSMKIDSLHAYFKHHTAPRLWIRSVMYEIEGNRKLRKPFQPVFRDKMERAITLAGLLNDRQLLSELYFLYADKYLNENPESQLFYMLKAIDIQGKVGFAHFPQVYLSFLAISRSMYRIMDYRRAINYGQECLQLMKTPATNMYCYILVLDLMGSSYKKLEMADSTAYCYHQINQILDSKVYAQYVYKTNEFDPIWRGVVAGGLAQALFLKKDYRHAYPLLLQNLSSSTAYGQWNDAALAANTLAKINLIEHQYDSSLYYYKKAYHWRSVFDDLLNLIDASKGIAEVYRITQRYDSAYSYLEQYHLFQDSLLTQMNKCNLSTLKAQVEFGNMEASLTKAQITIDRQRWIQNTILACIAIIGAISLLLYNRYRLKKDFTQQLRERKDKSIAAQMMHAKEQIAAFAAHIKEKDALIEQLQHPNPQNKQEALAINDRLRQYTLMTDEQWVKFKGEFIKAYPNFYARLYKVLCHTMTASEERLTALMYLRLSNGEIAGTLGISKDSVARSKRRLSQRITLPADMTLENFLFGDSDKDA